LSRHRKPPRRSAARQSEQAVEHDRAEFRTFAVRAASLDEQHRSVEADVATETPVPEWDWERWEMVPRVLLASGAQFPSNGQVPFLDSHNRSGTDSQLGSARELAKLGDRVRGRLFFSSTADKQYTKVREGHITDVSAGFTVQNEVHVPAGSTHTIDGRSFTGPVNVATKWKLREVSITPIGADEQAKLRAAGRQQAPPRGKFAMNEQLRALCVSKGMPEKATDEEAQRWLLDNFQAVEGKPASKTEPPQAGAERKAPPPAAPPAPPATFDAAAVQAIVRQALAENETQRAAAIAAHRKEVDELCELSGVRASPEIYALPDALAVRKHLIDERARAAPTLLGGVQIEPGPASRDKFREVVGTAFTLRCLENTSQPAAAIERLLPLAKRPKGHEQFRFASLLDIARECLRADGFNIRGDLTREQIAIAALGWPEKAGFRSGSPAYHTTGSFPNLVVDAINKSMQIGYEEVKSTWRGPMRQGMSAQDFKQIHRLRLGAVPNFPIWPDNDKPSEVSFADAQEQYAVEAYSLKFSFSWRLLVNDDMDVLSRAPAMVGAAAARTVNAAAWAQLTGNPTMGDGVALFSAASGARKQANLTTGVLPPSVAARQTLTNLMRQMRGENTPEGNTAPDILNLEPMYIIGPSALETTIMQLVNSLADPAQANPAVFNPARTLTPVIEPLLDASSAVAWYLFASPSQIDTVEVTFLQGQESVVTRDWVDEENLSRCWAAVQTFAAKALNHRGMQKAAGA
jgi:hypothetical protein